MMRPVLRSGFSFIFWLHFQFTGKAALGRHANMKTSFKFLIAGLTLAFASSAMAAASMKDVETAVNVNHDYRLAERLIGELTANNPDDARDHWVYAQILHHNSKDDQALRELNDAKRLDPKSSFVKDPHKVAVFEKSLNVGAHDAPTPAPVVATTPAPSHNAIVAQPLPEPTPAPAPHKSSHTLLWVILILAVVGVAAYFFTRRVQAGDRSEEEERIKTARQEQLKQASALLESVKPFKLDLRLANPPRPDLVTELESVERDLVALIERLSQMPVQQGEIDRLSARLNQVRRSYEGKTDPAPAPAASQAPYQNGPTGRFNDNEFSPVGGAAAAPVYQGQPGMQPIYQPGMQPVMQPVYQQPMQPVYIEENNGGIGAGGGFVAGMVMGSLLGEHEHRDREVIHEVREIREVREVPEERYRRDEPAQSDIDFGQESSSDNSNDSSGSVDFGSSDDDDN
jgi:flagellar basal body-associated protein FliL